MNNPPALWVPPRWAETARGGHRWLWAPSCSHPTRARENAQHSQSGRLAESSSPRLPDLRPKPGEARERPSTAPSGGRRGKCTRRSGPVQNLRLQQRTKQPSGLAARTTWKSGPGGCGGWEGSRLR